MTPGGVWDADQMEIRGLVRRDGVFAGEVVAAYTGTGSSHALQVDVSRPGIYEVTCYAHNPRNGNTGLDTTSFTAK